MYYVKKFLDFAPDVVPCDFYCYNGEYAYNSPSGKCCSRTDDINYEKDCKPFQIMNDLLIKNDVPNGSPREYEHVRQDRKFPMFRVRANNIEKIFRALEPNTSDAIISELDKDIEKRMAKRLEKEIITPDAQQDLKNNERIDELFNRIHFHINQKYCQYCPHRAIRPIESNIKYSDEYDEKSVLKLFDNINKSDLLLMTEDKSGDTTRIVYVINDKYKFVNEVTWGYEDNNFYIKKDNEFILVFDEVYAGMQDETAIKESDKPWYEVKNKVLSNILLNKLKSFKLNDVH